MELSATRVGQWVYARKQQLKRPCIMNGKKRSQLMVDPEIQGMLLRRISMFWLCCMLYIIIPCLVGVMYVEPEKTFLQQLGSVWIRFAPVLVAMLVLLPCGVYDLLKLSNRFVGPMHRLRGELRKLADGQEIQQLHFRSGDFWHDMAATVNKLSGELQRTRQPDQLASSSQQGG